MLDHVVTMPTEKYTDEKLFDEELNNLLFEHPMVACHSSSLPEPGSYVTSDWDYFPYIVVRDEEGDVRAFYNQCRHRGARLKTERSGCTNNFICPFHGWVYGLDGKLKGITRSKDFPGINKEDHGLVKIPATEFGGMVWVQKGVTSACDTELDIGQYLGSLADDLDNFDVASLTQYKKTKVIKEANWKLLIQTYLEGYHVPYLHRDTLAFAFKNGVIVHNEEGPHFRLTAARSNIDSVREVDRDNWRILDYASVYYVLFPNTFFILHPDYVSIDTFWPIASDRTVWTHEVLYRGDDFKGSSGQSALQKRFKFTNDDVFDQEDFAIEEDIQRAMVHGAVNDQTLGLAEGLLAMYQYAIDDQMKNVESREK